MLLPQASMMMVSDLIQESRPLPLEKREKSLFPKQLVQDLTVQRELRLLLRPELITLILESHHLDLTHLP